MMRTIQLHPLSLLAGVGIALLGLVAMGQAPVSRAPGGNYEAAAMVKGILNPHPRDMVQLYPATGLGTVVTLSPGGEHEVYVVPADRWLVLAPGSSSTISLAGGLLFEDRAGQLVEKAYASGNPGQAYGPSNAVLGWTFSPGSRVIIKNLSPFSPTDVYYNLFGYTTGL